MGDLPCWGSRGERFEFWQRDGVGDRLVGDLDLHVADDLVGRDADHIAVHPRPLIELNHRDRIGHLLGERWMVDAMIDDVAEDAAATAGFCPSPYCEVSSNSY